MGKQTNTITLNGKVYDAVTGHPVHTARAEAKVSHSHKTPQKTTDGVAHNKALQNTTSHVKANVKPAREHKPHVKHRQLQHSKTLMRHAVKQPTKHEEIRTNPTAITPVPAITVLQSDPVVLPTKDRTTRAKHIPKSKLISKFGPLGSQPSFVMSVEPVAVKAHPSDKATVATANNTHSESKTADAMFAKALERADSHHAKHKKNTTKHRRSRTLTAGATGLALVLLTGFIVMKTGPSVEFKLASSRAGIQATLPDYSPDGYNMNGPVEYAPGQVVVHYRSNSDDRSYSITQKASSWNSQALNTQVLGAATDYQTIQSKGKTIFLYDDGHATWVDGGIWYEIDGNGNLSQAQLTSIIDSF